MKLQQRYTVCMSALFLSRTVFRSPLLSKTSYKTFIKCFQFRSTMPRQTPMSVFRLTADLVKQTRWNSSSDKWNLATANADVTIPSYGLSITNPIVPHNAQFGSECHPVKWTEPICKRLLRYLSLYRVPLGPA